MTITKEKGNGILVEKDEIIFSTSFLSKLSSPHVIPFLSCFHYLLNAHLFCRNGQSMMGNKAQNGNSSLCKLEVSLAMTGTINMETKVKPKAVLETLENQMSL